MTGTQRKRLWRLAHPEESVRAERERAQVAAKYRKYDTSAKGRARAHRYNRTAKRLKAQRERNQVWRERAAHNELLTLANRGAE